MNDAVFVAGYFGMPAKSMVHFVRNYDRILAYKGSHSFIGYLESSLIWWWEYA